MMLALAIQAALGLAAVASPGGSWRAVLDLAGGPLPFAVRVERAGGGWQGRLCNGAECQLFSKVTMEGDSLVLEIADYAASMTAAVRGDSLVGYYHNVGSNGPRTIPFRAARGRWPITRAPQSLVGRWDATYFQELGSSPRVFEFRNGPAGIEGTLISSTSDYGPFSGTASADSFAIGYFDGSFVYLITGKLHGDTLRGTFHAGLRTQTPWQAVRSTGAPHLPSPTEITSADTTDPFRFRFPDLEGRVVGNDDPRFKGKVVLVDIFGTWCPTCHEGMPELIRFYNRYRPLGLEAVGLAFEVSGDTAVDAPLVRRYRDKFRIPFPLLLAGSSDVEAIEAALPQLRGAGAFPTIIFLGGDGRVRRIHAGFHGLAAGAQHQRQVREFEMEIKKLLKERGVNGEQQ
jgi:thiol-disulfide isomerase/thioredoxin